MGPVSPSSSIVGDERAVPDVRRRTLIRRWRTVIGFGGLVLAASFFFPAIQSCGAPVSPVGLVVDAVKDAQSNQAARPEWHEWLYIYLMCCGAYVIGGAVFLCMLCDLRSRRTLYAQQGRTLAIFLMATLATTNIFLVIVTGHSLRKGYSFEDVYRDLCANPGFPALVIISCWTIACCRAGRAKYVCIRSLIILGLIYWFGMHFVASEKSYFGLWMSLGGSILIWVGTVFEIKHMSRLSTLRALWGLMRCRLELIDPDDPLRCACGYSLIGLNKARCPECGREFDARLLRENSMLAG